MLLNLPNPIQHQKCQMSTVPSSCAFMHKVNPFLNLLLKSVTMRSGLMDSYSFW